MAPADTLKAALALAKEWGDLDTFVEHYADPKLHRYVALNGLAQGDARDVPTKRFLSPVELAALAALQPQLAGTRLPRARARTGR